VGSIIYSAASEEKKEDIRASKEGGNTAPRLPNLIEPSEEQKDHRDKFVITLTLADPSLECMNLIKQIMVIAYGPWTSRMEPMCDAIYEYIHGKFSPTIRLLPLDYKYEAHKEATAEDIKEAITHIFEFFKVTRSRIQRRLVGRLGFEKLYGLHLELIHNSDIHSIAGDLEILIGPLEEPIDSDASGYMTPYHQLAVVIYHCLLEAYKKGENKDEEVIETYHLGDQEKESGWYFKVSRFLQILQIGDGSPPIELVNVWNNIKDELIGAFVIDFFGYPFPEYVSLVDRYMKSEEKAMISITKMNILWCGRHSFKLWVKYIVEEMHAIVLDPKKMQKFLKKSSPEAIALAKSHERAIDETITRTMQYYFNTGIDPQIVQKRAIRELLNTNIYNIKRKFGSVNSYQYMVYRLLRTIFDTVATISPANYDSTIQSYLASIKEYETTSRQPTNTEDTKNFDQVELGTLAEQLEKDVFIL
jgi:hypothetical protein